MWLTIVSVVKLTIATYREHTTPRKRRQNMKPSEYFDAAKTALNIQSDYELAKRFGVGNGRIAMIKSGERPVPLDIAYKLAITLNLDPAEVVADLESQREKNPTRQAFWRSFIKHARTAAAMVACMLALNFGGFSENAQAALGGLFRPRKYA